MACELDDSLGLRAATYYKGTVEKNDPSLIDNAACHNCGCSQHDVFQIASFSSKMKAFSLLGDNVLIYSQLFLYLRSCMRQHGSRLHNLHNSAWPVLSYVASRYIHQS